MDPKEEQRAIILEGEAAHRRAAIDDGVRFPREVKAVDRATGDVGPVKAAFVRVPERVLAEFAVVVDGW